MFILHKTWQSYNVTKKKKTIKRCGIKKKKKFNGFLWPWSNKVNVSKPTKDVVVTRLRPVNEVQPAMVSGHILNSIIGQLRVRQFMGGSCTGFFPFWHNQRHIRISVPIILITYPTFPLLCPKYFYDNISCRSILRTLIILWNNELYPILWFSNLLYIIFYSLFRYRIEFQNIPFHIHYSSYPFRVNYLLPWSPWRIFFREDDYFEFLLTILPIIFEGLVLYMILKIFRN